MGSQLSAQAGSAYYPGLDGLRCIAVCLVICNHLAVDAPDQLLGYLGVDIFFVISGFLITSLLLREYASNGRISLGAFYTRRFFRIVPAYLVCILLYQAATLVAGDDERTEQFRVALPYLLTFTREFAPESAGNVFGHAWSLGVEEKFYAIWPLLLRWLVPISRHSLACIALLSVATLALPAFFARSYGGLMIGIWLALVIFTHHGKLTSVRRSMLGSSLSIVFLVLTYCLVVRSPSLVLLFSLAFAAFLANVILHDEWPRRVLESQLLTFIGRRSYSIYLVHVLASNVVTHAVLSRWRLHWSAAALLVLGISLLVASCLYVLIEQPMIRLGRHLAAARRPAASS